MCLILVLSSYFVPNLDHQCNSAYQNLYMLCSLKLSWTARIHIIFSSCVHPTSHEVKDAIAIDDVDVGILGQSEVTITVSDLRLRSQGVQRSGPLLSTLLGCIKRLIRQLYTLLDKEKA